MDYADLAAQFLRSMRLLHLTRPHKAMSESMQGEIFVLQYLYKQGDHVLPGEISSVMNISSARTAAALNSMEQKGLVTREINTHDRRQILVSITQQGKDLAHKHHREVIDNTAMMLSLLGEDDAKEYIRITNKLADICGNKMKFGE
jgi:DNA-binding MarR family transcriptional regulator